MRQITLLVICLSVKALRLGKNVKVEVEFDSVIATVHDEYVSVAIDSLDWRDINLAHPAVEVLASGYYPAHVRIGGSQQDYDVFLFGQYEKFDCDNPPYPMTSYNCRTVTPFQWGNLLDFADNTKLDLIFGVNDMFGRPTKETHPPVGICDTEACPPNDQSNIAAVMEWTTSHRPRARIYGYETGNELNSCLNGKVGAKTQAYDLIDLQSLIEQYYPDPSSRPVVLGPDTHSGVEYSSSGLEWLEKYVSRGGDAVEGITFHMYCLGKGSDLDPSQFDSTFLNASALDYCRKGAQNIIDLVGPEYAGKLWAGETASAGGMGAQGITDTFVNGFWFLDQLGSFAALGVKVFIRQTFTGMAYCLVNVTEGVDGQTDVLARPDYWSGLLFKRVMGNRVFRASSSEEWLRVYAHCGREGGVALTLINLGRSSASVDISSLLGTVEEWAEGEYLQWILTAGQLIPDARDSVQSQDILLNGRLLELVVNEYGDYELPSLKGEWASGEVFMPPTSYGFVVIGSNEPEVCGAT
jgi:heparanase